MTVRTTKWPLDSQTLGKHLVLEEYLKAWIPILASKGGPFLFIDGFAGPGRYSEGEEGSPLIAMRTLRDHSALSRIPGPLRFVFIEPQAARFTALQEEIAALTVPSCATVSTINGHFSSTLTTALDKLAAEGKSAAPALVMADPFGIDDVPMSLLRRVLGNKGGELYITVMASFIHRFVATPEFERPLNELYGTNDWARLAASYDGEDRRRALLNLYEKQLRANGARFVLRFHLYRGNSYVYSIFFATCSELGCEKMKDALWKVMPDGVFEYRDNDASQIALGVKEPHFATLERQLLGLLADGAWTRMSNVDRWGQCDQTMFRKAHLRTALRSLEQRGHIEADRKEGRQFSAPVLVRRVLSAGAS